MYLSMYLSCEAANKVLLHVCVADKCQLSVRELTLHSVFQLCEALYITHVAIAPPLRNEDTQGEQGQESR